MRNGDLLANHVVPYAKEQGAVAAIGQDGVDLRHGQALEQGDDGQFGDIQHHAHPR